MKKNQQNYKWIKHSIAYYLTYGVVIISCPMLTYANDENTIESSTNQSADFDSSFIIGDNAQNINIDRFKFGNPVLPGEYSVDVYLNDIWTRKQHITFKADEQKLNAFTCFTASNLIDLDVKTDIIKQKIDDLKSPECLKIGEWIEDAYYEFDSSKLRLDISIPQVALNRNAQGYIDPSLWDRGINAGFLSYNASAYKNYDTNNHTTTTNAFSSINAGINLAGWQFRHNGQWQWQDTDALGNKKSKAQYDAVSTYIQRALPKYRSVLSLGDSFTNGEIFDSFGFRGIDFSSDDRMLPDSLLGYAPVIRGYAKTNAKVEVRQQDQIIYQTTVAAGNFEITDLYPTGFGGELKVSIFENDGNVQTFTVPYASVVQMLRPGMKRYAFTLGQFRDNNLDSKPLVFQAKYQQGINNYITGFVGIQVSSDYQAVSVGTAFATPIGAISLDATHSQVQFNKHQNGQSYRLSYSKLITPTRTNLTLAAYRYSTENFYKLRDALLIKNLEKNGESTSHLGKQRSEFQITLNQDLPRGWGNFYATGSLMNFWNRNESQRQYQIGYSNNYHNLTYGLSATKSEIENKISGNTSNDTQYMLTLSLPLSLNKSSININTITTRDNVAIGASGMIGDRFSYGTSMSTEYGNNPSLNANAQYKTNFSTFGASYSMADSYQQVMASASGNIVAHRHGITFGPDQGQTMVIVYAPNAVGAQVNNATGLTINKSGYAVIPYVTPYRVNNVTLDPQNMSTDVELIDNSQRIAPFNGAIAQVNFATKTGKAIYIHSLRIDGKSLPFAAEVFNAKDENIGMVAQGSLIYVRTDNLKDVLTVKWGGGAASQCQVPYDITALEKNESIISLEAICQ